MPTRRRRSGILLFVGIVAVVAAVTYAVWRGGDPLPELPGCSATVAGRTVDLEPDQAENATLIAAIGLRRGLPAVQARGYDELPPDTLAGFDGTCAGSVEPDALRAALSASVRALLHEGAEAGLAHAVVVAERLSPLH